MKTQENFSGADGTTVVSKGAFIGTTLGPTTVFQCDGSGGEKIVAASEEKSGILADTGNASHYLRHMAG